MSDHFVFSIGGLKQNVKSLLTPVSGTVFHALSHGSLHFVLHGSLINRQFRGRGGQLWEGSEAGIKKKLGTRERFT